jgi:Glycogen recognition site of AMP-activated protein kinase
VVLSTPLYLCSCSPNLSTPCQIIGTPKSSEGLSSGSTLVRTMFKWSGGGREVYVTGSFNEWKEKIPLTVTSADTIFSVVCNLPPGSYQYKFIVDGEWVHATDQKITTGLWCKEQRAEERRRGGAEEERTRRRGGGERERMERNKFITDSGSTTNVLEVKPATKPEEIGSAVSSNSPMPSHLHPMHS